MPWELNIAKSEGAAPLVKLPQDDLENGCQTGFSFKRCKLYQTSSCIDKVGSCSNFIESGKRSCGQQIKFVSLPHKTRSVNNFSGTSPVQVHCTVTGREMHGQCRNAPGILCYTEKDSNSDMLCSRSSRKVLLEFNSESFYKYKLLQIGGIYIIKHCAEKCFCDSHQMNLGSSVLITSELNFWSLSFHFSEAIDCMSGPCNDPLPTSYSTSENLNRFYLQNELVLSPCSSAEYGTFSDIILHVRADANGLLDVVSGFQAFKELVINLSQKLTDISNIDQQVLYENNVMGFLQNQVMYSGNVLPEGNLISLRGLVISLQNSSCSTDRMPGNGVAHNICQPRFMKEKEESISMLVLTNGHLVEICGRLSKLDCPVGFGPGSVVTFHRILACSGQNCVILTPVSFITVNIVSEIPSPSVNFLFPNREESVASCLISDLIRSDMCQPRIFRCSIVAVYFVMLERNKSLDKLLSHFHSETPVVNIPLAGFIVDDGSSHCCCWTNGDQAATFLRLHEEIPQAGSVSSWWKLKAAVKGRTLSSPSNQLHRILKKHGKVRVKNYGSMHEILCQDLQLSVSTEDTFGSQDENLLKFIMLNACSSTLWNVIGHAMNFDAVNMLEKKLHEEQMTMHALQNVWAEEVCQVNPLAQAKALLKDL